MNPRANAVPAASVRAEGEDAVSLAAIRALLCAPLPAAENDTDAPSVCSNNNGSGSSGSSGGRGLVAVPRQTRYSNNAATNAHSHANTGANSSLCSSAVGAARTVAAPVRPASIAAQRPPSGSSHNATTVNGVTAAAPKQAPTDSRAHQPHTAPDAHSNAPASAFAAAAAVTAPPRAWVPLLLRSLALQQAVLAAAARRRAHRRLRASAAAVAAARAAVSAAAPTAVTEADTASVPPAAIDAAAEAAKAAAAAAGDPALSQAWLLTAATEAARAAQLLAHTAPISASNADMNPPNAPPVPVASTALAARAVFMALLAPHTVTAPMTV